MKSPKEFLDRLKRGPRDIVGIDLGSTGTKAVRIRKTDSQNTVLGVALLPAVGRPWQEGEPPPEAIALPAKLRARYAALSLSGEEVVIKLLSLSVHSDTAIADKVVQSMDSPDDYRVAYKVVSEGHGRTDTRVLAVSLPETQAQSACMLLPSGLPAPYSLEVSGLATLTAFSHTVGLQHAEDAVGVIDFGANASTFALFNKGSPALVRRFEIGTNAILEKVQETLGVDEQTARGIIADGAFDISQSVGEVLEILMKQLVVSRDFVERKENCRFSIMYVSGGLAASRDSLDEMRSSMGVNVESWNPFEGLNLAQGAFPEQLAGQEWRFSAAVGACLGTFEAT